MKNTLENIMEFNEKFVANKDYTKYIASKIPNKQAVVVSCMDTRLTELLPKAMNIKNGDVKIVKNAGATVVHPFGSALRSIIVAVYEFDAKDIFVVGHHGCGMSNIEPLQMIEKMKAKGIAESTLKTLEYSGIDLTKWLKGFTCVKESVTESVNTIKNHPLMPIDVNIHGLIIDSETGKLDLIIDGTK
ncbi:carbonic anhydrase [uncultured Clostridium sp.]|jgi:carbonic anhydrase|uniref:beta-class carbonic anhydrase n=1 Tax=uncultured Clostridium sp. TaxID=59620 RepID=UPI00261C4926|nr:carbonic anhydrase [uncultured Clostridium sp.]